MRTTAMSVLISIVMAATAAIPATGAAPETSYPLPFRVASPQVRGDLEAQVVSLINRDRRKAGLPVLQLNPALREAARGHGREMFQYGYLSHTSRGGATPVERAMQAGARASMFGENLAYAATVADAHQRLMASPGHRRNILSPAFRRVGVGVLDGGSRGVIVVENFSN